MPGGVLHRSITTIELMQIQRMFSFNRGYKDLMRDFKHDFGAELPKQMAKQFIAHRSWREVLKWLTGEEIDTKDLDKIPQIETKHYELLDAMIELNKQDEEERKRDIERFNSQTYYIPKAVKFFNFPLYGEIITYRYKEPFLKCFLFDETTHKINKIEDVPVSNELPAFLLAIIRKINSLKIETDTIDINAGDYQNYITTEEIQQQNIKNVFDSELFQKYKLTFKQ